MFQLKNDFENVKNIVDKIAEIKTAIKKKLGQLKEIHADLIKTNDSKKIFLICLESFHFQYKAMIFDSDNLQRNFLLLTNRTFCDYTSLYGLLQKMFEDYKIDIPSATVHPVYNDLDPYCEYKNVQFLLLFFEFIQNFSQSMYAQTRRKIKQLFVQARLVNTSEQRVH